MNTAVHRRRNLAMNMVNELKFSAQLISHHHHHHHEMHCFRFKFMVDIRSEAVLTLRLLSPLAPRKMTWHKVIHFEKFSWCFNSSNQCFFPLKHNSFSLFWLSPSKATKNVFDVGVVSSRFGDGHAQLCVTQGANSRDDSRQEPYNQGHAHWAGILQDAFRTDKDPWADDVTFVGKMETNTDHREWKKVRNHVM